MLVLRSVLFNLTFYVTTFVQAAAGVPLLVLPRLVTVRLAQLWARNSLRLLRLVAGTKVEFRGLERIPKGGLIVACKHQSMVETFALLPVFEDPAFILKRELMWIPFFGWCLWKGGMVPINRKAGALALIEMNRRAKAEVARGRQILIFPEGTRRPPDAEAAYKYGIAHLYRSLKVPCVPVALNSGLYWPRHSFLRRPGTIVLEFLEPIAPGLSRDAFFAEMQSRIEVASQRLLAEGRRDIGVQEPEAATASTT